MQNYELYHYGVKGMKWGVRRYQDKSGSLTSAGRRRYYDTDELNRQKANVQSAKKARDASFRAYDTAKSKYGYWPSKANKEAFEAAEKKYNFDNVAYRRAKLTYKTNKEAARIQDKGITFDNKSKHRLQLEEQYRNYGMSAEQAQAAANNRIRLEKTLAAVAGLTVTAAAAYTANKMFKDRMDQVLKAGTTLQRIEMQDTGGKLHNVFYAAAGKHDTQRYYNLLGSTRQKQVGEAYVMKLLARKDVKVASQSKCREVFKELWLNDASFRDTCKSYGIGLGKSNPSRKVYDEFNRSLVNMHKSSASKQFYDKLKAAGYGAIQDVNDMKYSGYAARNPLIIFDNAKDNISVQSVKRIQEDLSTKGTAELGKAMVEHLLRESADSYGSVAAVAAVAAAATTHYKDPTKRYKK